MTTTTNQTIRNRKITANGTSGSGKAIHIRFADKRLHFTLNGNTIKCIYVNTINSYELT